MSLYHEAARILQRASEPDSGSIDSIVFATKDWKSPTKVLYALACETAKWSQILSEVLDRSGLLTAESQV